MYLNAIFGETLSAVTEVTNQLGYAFAAKSGGGAPHVFLAGNAGAGLLALYQKRAKALST
jgi:hypothetical protein